MAGMELMIMMRYCSVIAHASVENAASVED